MATLTGSTIENTYDRLLALDSGGLNGANLVQMTDGNASATCALQVSTVAICISDPTTSSATEGALLRLQSNDSAAVTGSGHRLGIIEFSGEEDASDTMVAGAQIYAIADAAFTASGTYDHATRLEFATQSGASGTDALATPAMVIDSTGYVGIGTKVPTHILTISSASGQDTLMVARDDYNAVTAGETLGSMSFGANHASASSFAVGCSILGEVATNWSGTNSASNLKFYTVADASTSVGTAEMTIMHDGKVGIGTDTPISALEIEDGLTTTGAVLSLGTKEPSVVANDVLGRINFYAPLDTGTDSDEIGASIAAVAQATFSDNINSTSLYFQTGKSEVATTKMVIDEDGNIGIGTLGPAAKVEVTLASDEAIYGVCSAVDDTETARVQVQGVKTGGSSYRFAHLGIIYNASGTGADDETCGYVRMDQSDGGSLYMWSQNDNDIQVSLTANDIGSTDGVAVGSQGSDERLKNISSDTFPYGLNEINQLTPIKYKWKKNPTGDILGFGAQTTQSIIPECVYNTGNCPDGYTQDLYTADDDKVIKGKKKVGDEKGTQTPKSSEKDKLYMKYVEIIPVLVKAVQELSAKVTALENA